MGYFTNAAIFTSEPNFARVSAEFTSCSARGYQHRSRPLWLLDLWEKPKRGDHYPLQDQAGPREVSMAHIKPASAAFLQEFDTLLAALKSRRYGGQECRLTATISALSGVPTFFFAGDDEATDFACNAAEGEIQTMRWTRDNIAVAFANGTAGIEPGYFEEDGEDEPPAADMQIIRRSVNWPIAEPVSIERWLFGNAIKLWPKAAGNPKEFLSWDPFKNLANDFTVVYERLI